MIGVDLAEHAITRDPQLEKDCERQIFFCDKIPEADAWYLYRFAEG